ncbi:hypothetical protein GINT2_002233 [Glugoides intestinalis]
MNKTEFKRKSIPGAREVVNQIKQITQEIISIDADIKEFQDSIHTIIAAEKSKSPKAKILTELREINDAKEAIKSERRNYFTLVENTKGKIDALRSETSIASNGFNSIEKINKALEDLELRLISTSVSAKEELEIAASMTNLRSQKHKLSEMESNFKAIEELDASIKEYKGKITVLSKNLNEKTAAADALKAELEKISETTKGKLPEVQKLENKIAALKTQKTELMKNRTIKREEVHALEQEYAKFEEVLLVQKSLEEQKDAIRKNISALKQEKENLLNENDSYDPKLYDSLIFTINKMKKSKELVLDIDIVNHLIKNSIKIPKSIEDLDECINLLNKKKEACIVSFKEKKGKLSSVMADIDSKIAAEVESLNALPETDFEILKKGGFKKDFKIANKN